MRGTIKIFEYYTVIEYNCYTDLAEHIKYSYYRDEHRGLWLVEAEADAAVGDVHVGHIIPHVQQEVGQREHQERGVLEVREVQHVHRQVPEVPQTRVPLHLEESFTNCLTIKESYSIKIRRRNTCLLYIVIFGVR